MSQRGQASLEFLAVVALVGLVLVVGGAAASASSIGKRVTAHMARGLCVVTGGGDCDGDRLPCPVRWRRDQRSAELSVAIVRVGGGLLVVREERSDGTVAVTLAGEGSGGVEAGRKGRLGVVDAELRASLLAAQGYGRRWVLPGRAAAARFDAELRAIVRARRLPDLPPADEAFHERTAARLQATAQLVAEGLGGEVALSAEALGGVRESRATGERTVYLRVRGDASARLRAGAARGRGKLGVRAAGSRELAVTFDRDGVARTLVTTATTPGGALPEEASEAAGLLPPGGALVVERRLDLGDPGAREAAREALRGRFGALDVRLRRDAVVHVRAYELRSRSTGGGVDLGPVGVGVDRTREDARLTGAITRDAAGSWLRRQDCLSA